MTSILQQGGAQSKPSKYSAVHVSKALHGLVTNRFAFQDPSTFIVEKFYGGYQDVLLGGFNVEISPRNTWIRRPGTSAFTTFNFPTPPLTATSFNLNGVFSTFVDTAANIYSVTPTTGTSIFTKSAGAGQTSFLQLGGVLYFGDGVETKKLINGVVWNWGIDGPATAPTLNIVESAGATASSWVASTIYSTMGLLLDSNGNVQQLQSVNADGSNPAPSQIGETGNGQPAWDETPGGTTSDNSITWTNYGPVVAWAPHKTFANVTPSGGTLVDPCAIFDPVSQSCYVNATAGAASGVTGSSKPAFTGGFASVVHDGSVKWFCAGTPKSFALWQASHSYPAIGTVLNNESVSAIVQPLTCQAAGIGGANPQTIFLQASSGGTSGSGGSAPPWSTAIGTLTSDNQISWLCLGSGTWAAHTSYTGWSGNGTPFSVINDGTNFQVAISAGVNQSGGSTPSWSTLYGQTTVDGSVTWTCVGTKLSWATNTKWFLPTGGFIPPQPTDAYGGAAVNDTNGNVQFVTISGKSGSSAPSWNATKGGSTTDGGITWFNDGGFSAVSLTWTKGFGYLYAFKSRTADDFFVTNIPNGLTVPLGPPTGSADGSISTASPAVEMATAPNNGAIINVSGVGSLDPQVDTVVIYRSTDGTQSGPHFELTEIPNPPAINGVAQPWTFQDSFTDLLGLDDLIEADQVGANSPPPAGLLNLCYTQGRIWGSVGNIIYASSGPDIPVDNGNGLTGFNAANNFPLTSPISATIALNNGILVFTTTDEWSILGGPSIFQFFPAIIRQGMGLLSTNAITQLGAEILLFSADRRLISFIPGAGETEPGLPIADQFEGFDPSQVYLTLYENGLDQGIFLADGSTGMFRLVPHSYPNNDAVWSTFGIITGGCGMVKAITSAPGVRSLLIGSTANNQPIVKRDVSVNTDNGTPFTAEFTVGGIPLTHDSEVCELGFLTWTGPRAGSAPTVSYLLDEASGTFVVLPDYVSDPPILYGPTGQPTSVYRNRYYFQQSLPSGAAPSALICTDIQVKVQFPAEDAANEMARFTIYGGLLQDAND